MNARTPREAVQLLLEAGDRGDVDGYSEILGGLTAASFRRTQARHQLLAAVERRFGDTAAFRTVRTPLARELRAKYENVRYQVVDERDIGQNRVLVTVQRDTPLGHWVEDWLAIRVGAVWRIVLPGRGKVRMSEWEGPEYRPSGVSRLVDPFLTTDRSNEIAEENRWAAALTRLAEDVARGKYKNAGVVKEKVNELWEKP